MAKIEVVMGLISGLIVRFAQSDDSSDCPYSPYFLQVEPHFTELRLRY